jgi:predicted metal-dependent phosphoesterase TrpH
MHMLGLFLDHRDQQFQETMARFREGRIARVHKIVSNLAEVGVNISVDRVFAIAGEASVEIEALKTRFESWLPAYMGAAA